jgi:hypothetical protein
VTGIGVNQLGVTRSGAGAFVQSPNAGCGTVDNTSEFGAEFRCALFEQPLLRFFRGKPGGVAIRFLRRFEPGHFAKVGNDGKLGLGRLDKSRPRVFSKSCSFRFPAEVAGEGDFFHPAMNASLFKSLEGSGLGVCVAGFNAAFGENPTPAATLNQQEFDAASVDAVAHGGHLLASFRKS